MMNSALINNSVYAVSDINFVAPQLPQFTFHQLIAQGVMGSSYDVTQKSLERRAVCKIIAKRFGADEKFQHAFTDHAKASAKFSHSNLVKVYDFGLVESMFYILQEYVSYTTLYDATGGARVEHLAALNVMSSLCSGISHAHESGVIHGDLKPTSIFMTSELEPKINGFGLASKLRLEGNKHVSPYDLHYTAPETYFGAMYSDELTDIYSLGAILYFMITAQLVSSFCILSTGNQTLDYIITKALSLDRKSRYQSAQEMEHDIHSLIPELGVTTTQTKPTSNNPRFNFPTTN
jgi:serine/threonine protein kinase